MEKIRDDIPVATKKPKDCPDCVYFGTNGEHIISGKAHFPSLCEKDLMWFQCNGKQGVKNDNKN